MTKPNSPLIIDRYPKNTGLTTETFNVIEALRLNSNPVHFSLIYEYVAGIDPYFSAQIKDALQANTYCDETAETLYIELISQFLNLHLPTAEVESLLRELLNEIEAWNVNAQRKQAALSDDLNFIVNLESVSPEIRDRLTLKTLPTLQAFFTDTERLRDSVVASSLEIKQLKNELEQAKELAKTDELTGIPNRRGFNSFLEKTLKEAQRQASELSVIIIDLDFFKVINDTYGHLIGDSALRYIAKLLDAETKGQDYIARVGGEEFAIILPNTHYNSALKVAENIRASIAQKKLSVKDHNQPLALTISGGVTSYRANETMEAFLQRVDDALYHAKDHGRNKICGDTEL